MSGRLAGGCVRLSGISASAWVRGRFAGGGARFSLKVITTNGSGSEESGLSRRNGNNGKYTASVLLLRNELVVLHICVSACY